MARINPVDPDQAQGKATDILAGVQKALGMTPNLFKTLAHAPAALEAYLGLNKTLAGGRLQARLREQIAVVVAGANACEYCASAHTAIGRSLGLDADELERNLGGSSQDPRIQAALRFARAIVTKRGWVSDTDLDEVRAAGYTDGDIAEIVGAVALNTFSNYFNHVAQTEVDFPRVEVDEPVVA